MIEGTNQAVALALGIIALGAALSRWYFKTLKPRMHARELDRIAQRDVLVGRPAIPDSITGKLLAPALPGIGQRMDTIEAAVAELARSNQRHEAHEAHLKRHDEEITALKSAQMERIITRAESTAAWHAIAAVHGEGDAEPETDADADS